MPPRINLPMGEIIKDYESGINSVELGKRHGVSDVTIVNRLKEHGVEIRSKGKKDLPMNEIALLYYLGLSLRKLGDIYGVNDKTIRYKLAELRN